MPLKNKLLALTLGLLTCMGSVLAHEHSEPYQVKSGVAGTITSVGSDTMSNLISIWAEEFNQRYPQVNFQLQSAGSSTAPPAMIQGTASIGPMSRSLKRSEQDAFYEEFGYAPTLVPVALDAITLFVDLDNPVNSLKQEQIDSIFSVTRFCGGAESIDNWAQINGAENYPYRIRLYGRSAVSGTYGLFKNKVLCDGDFKAKVAELPSSSSIVQSVAFFKGAMGYAAWGFQNAGVKLLSVQNNAAQAAVAPSESNIRSGLYPYSRFLYLLVNKEPDKPLPNPYLEFIRFIYSKEGDAITRREGYVPLGLTRSSSVLKELSD
ncbi:PstS family phosphate ABC transporter substrate-binding protein [Planctobacterium marinum]|uniref:Phosphate-binding protein n=1 Tax=Planctobacterium marinum TaxID=1631968 RepID=A0AA48HNY0_9ALTE|nr:phosphate-binding protein PstS [Planctobacterium marinum]